MTPKEKAQELVDKYRTYIRAGDKYEYLDPEDEVYLAKQCAVITVDEIQKCVLYTTQKHENDRFSEDYWEKVKNELNKPE
jgi:hypothetical protein